MIVGREDLIGRIRKNPLKRALRVDKITLAALEAVLRLHRDPETLRAAPDDLRLLTRTRADLRRLGERLLAPLRRALASDAAVELRDCQSQIGSGSLPVDLLPSVALVITPAAKGREIGNRAEDRWRRGCATFRCP